MKLLLSCKRKINKDKNGEVVSHLEILEVVLIHSNIANNDYQQDQESFIHLFLINLGSIFRYFMSSTFMSEFLCISVWFIDKNSKPLETEGKIYMTLLIF